MSDMITKFNIELHERVTAVQDRLDSLKTKVKGEASEANKTMHDYVETLDRKIDQGRDKLDDARADIEDWADEHKETIHDWTSKRELNKLRKRAERTARYSEAAFDVALNAIEEAEAAMLRNVLATGDLEAAEAQKAA